MNRKIVFLHIPKTAGRSIYTGLSEKTNNYLYVHNGMGGSIAFSEIYNSKKYLEELKKGFTFCFVRNPWDRMVSNYFYIYKMYNKLKDDKEQSKKEAPTFRKYVVNNFEDFNDFVERVDKGLMLRQFHFKPQISFIKSIKKYIDFIGHYENLDTDIAHLSEEFGISLSLPLINNSDNRSSDYTEYYNSKAIKVVKKLYKKDIDEFNYKFGD